MNNWIKALLESDILQEVDSDADLQALATLAQRMDQASAWICESPILTNLHPTVADVISRSIGHTAEAVTAWHHQQAKAWAEEKECRYREQLAYAEAQTLKDRARLGSVL